MSAGTIYHRHGGVILNVRAIAHETYRGVATWHYLGDVEWDDGTKTENRQLMPHDLCIDQDDEEAQRALENLSAQLAMYLERHGNWHAPKHTRDGRVIHWTPHNKEGREEL